MGKAQSKRSVDITTENKKGPEEEVTGKLEKIEDIDQKQVNGDATPPESVEAVSEKKEADVSEHDKDMTTEKSAVEATKAGGDNAGDQNNTTTASVSVAADAPKDEDGAVAATKEGAAEEITPLADESMKKTKKEKVKKKWSLRSISFGKKDKQKPPKTEETAEGAAAAAATNGEAEKPAEGVAETAQKDAAGGDAAAETKPTDKLENGDATEKELNGQKTPTPTEEKPAEVVANDANTNATAAAATSASVPTALTTNNETANEIQTESKIAVSGESVEASAAAVAAVDAAIVSNGTDIAVAAAEKNGIIDNVAPVVNNDNVNEAAVKEVAAVIENIKSIPSDVVVVEKLHQNGMNSEELEAEAEQSKSQIEMSVFAFNAENVESDAIPAPVAIHASEDRDQPEVNEALLSPVEAVKPDVEQSIQKEISDENRVTANALGLVLAERGEPESPNEPMDSSKDSYDSAQPSAGFHEETAGDKTTDVQLVDQIIETEVELPAEGSKSEVELATIEETVNQLAAHAEQLMETGDRLCGDSDEHHEMRARIAELNFKELSPAQRKLFLKLLREEHDLEEFLTEQALELLTELDEDDNVGYIPENIEKVCYRMINDMKRNAPQYLAEQFMVNIVKIIETVSRLAEDGAEKKQLVQGEQIVEGGERENSQAVDGEQEQQMKVKPIEEEQKQIGDQQQEEESKTIENQAEPKQENTEENDYKKKDEQHKSNQIEIEAKGDAADAAAFASTKLANLADETDKEIDELQTDSDKKNIDDVVASAAALSIDSATPPPSIGEISDNKPSSGDACFSSSSLNAPIITETLVPLNDCDADVNPN